MVVFSINDSEKNWITTCKNKKNNKLDLIHTKIILKWVIDVKVQSKAITYLEVNTGEILMTTW